MPVDPMFGGSNSVEDDGFLKTIKILSTTSFGDEVKPSVPCHKILQLVKDPYRYEKQYVSSKQNPAISRQVSPAPLLGVSVIARELWWMNQE
jgi:hypothetical protein